MAIKIERAGTAFNDWEQLRRFVLENFAYMDGVINPPSSVHRLDAAAVETQARNEWVYVALDDARLVACMFLTSKPDSLYVGKLAVDPDYRGAGLACKLIDQANSIALASQIDTLSLHTRIELTDNQAAFERLGFARTGYFTHDGFDRPTSVEMRRSVSEPQ